ncbi:hypothetical protein [Agrococcus beijingensis]|uniref:hypothetical protein n=1 Tax=Agrococcus beijingensis TaxID=3068634 RepID=UPI0027426D80|nr:hypothetical protein [Agrococcus sp. REN33]
MPLLFPLVLALVIAAGACLLWIWARSIARRPYGGPVASLVVVIAAVGVWLLIASDGADASVPAAAGWAALGGSALVLVGGWIALAKLTDQRER